MSGYSIYICEVETFYGFSSDPRQVANTINGLLPSFRCKKLFNIQSFGDDDDLGLLLNHLYLSNEGPTQYGFVVGSEKQNHYGVLNYVTRAG